MVTYKIIAYSPGVTKPLAEKRYDEPIMHEQRQEFKKAVSLKFGTRYPIFYKEEK